MVFIHVIRKKKIISRNSNGTQALGMRDVQRNRSIVFVDFSNLVSCTSFLFKMLSPIRERHARTN